MSEEIERSERIIRTMPLALANKIAAGEVVQRPASALKELIENAIDAGATEVKVFLKSAGSELVQVVDNGCGMCPEDALASFERHATSKIQAIEDLESIRTLGFRGEALASIAAVAQVEMKTRRLNDEMGFRVRIDGGEVSVTEPCAHPAGTSIAIRNLFFNVPARRSFLKSPATEFKHLVETFQFLALSHPEIAFALHHDTNEVYDLPASGKDEFYASLKSRIGDLFGTQYVDSLIRLEEETSYLSIRGFMGDPEFHKRSRGDQFMFVNERFIKSRYLEHAVRSAYDNILPEGAYPFFILFLRIDPRHMDVNVHPTKSEVKFDDERGIYGFIRTVAQKGLSTSLMAPQFSFDQDGMPPSAMPGFPQATPGAAPWMPPAQGIPSARGHASDAGQSPGFGFSGTSGRSPGKPFVSRSGGTVSPGLPLGDLTARMYEHTEPEGDEGMVIPSDSHEETDREVLAHDGSLLWQLHNSYILTQIRTGMMIIDQNAAHERILFEQAMNSLESGFGLSQQLLFPHTLEFDPAEFELIKELMPSLRALGFEIDLFGGRSVIVRGVPSEMKVGDEQSILEELLDQFRSNQDTLKLKARENLAKSLARRGAIRSGTPMDVKEMRSLVDQLFLCKKPHTSPSGRPVILNISMEELDTRFGKR